MDPHKPLRDDVRLLGELLGATLREQAGETLFQTVERVRALAKQARAGDGEDFHTLALELSRLPVEAAVPVARAFAHFLNLANVAEQHHRTRRRRAYQRDPGAAPQRGSCDEAFARLLAEGVTPDQLFDAVCALRIELVLTAHPTEVARRTLVQKYNRIAGVLALRDRADLTPLEAEQLLDALQREIAAAWGTSEVRATRPTPLDEVRSGLIVFEQSLWDAVPRYLRTLDRALLRVTGRRLPLEATPLRFGSWIGGDRDGNPAVTPAVTRQASLLSRWVAADLYLREIDALRDELSLEHASPELETAGKGAPEPYRELLRGVRARMLATRQWAEAALAVVDLPPGDDVYVDAGDFAAPLQLCARSLEATGQGRIADGRLTELLRRVSVFGLTLARLDIRQEARRHTDALAAVTTALGIGSYGEWDESARLAFLAREIASRRPLLPRDLAVSPDVQDVFETFRMMAALPPGSLGAYVITMASRASDVLAVELLQKEAGVQPPARVVPLFETARDLAQAGEVIDRLLGDPDYRTRIDGRQEVMIGYSDSAKEVGRFAAGWRLYEAQEAIVAACRRHAIRVTLFHGRGGSVGRGGGPTHLALTSQPPGSIDGTLRVTEQGEMLQVLFGLPDIAIRTMEVYTSGTLEAWLRPAGEAPSGWRACMQRLAADAEAAYRAVVHEHPRFLDYFQASTPQAEIAELNIGSRPARRRGDVSVTTLRAIPWQFAWTQTRLLLAAWLGVEAAIEQALSRGEGDRLREMYREWPHFRSALSLIEMVLAKADSRIAAEYDRRLVPEDLHAFGAGLRERLERAAKGVTQVTGHELLATNPVLRRSIDVRNPYVDPINLVQVELLCRLRRDADPRVRAALMVTVNGVAAGMRNTG